METITKRKTRNNRTYEMNRIFTLNEPNAPRLNPALAVEIGLNESIIFLQLEFWIAISDNVRDGRKWTYQSAADIKEKMFPFWSASTINRALNNLLARNLIIDGNYNQKKYDRTRWFAIDFDEARKLKSITVREDESRSTQNELRSAQDESRSAQNETTIPETTTKTNTESNPPSASPHGERDGGKGDFKKENLNHSNRRRDGYVEHSQESIIMAERLRELIQFPDTPNERAALGRLCHCVDDKTYGADEIPECAIWMVNHLDRVAVTPTSIERYIGTFVAKKRMGALEPKQHKTKSQSYVEAWSDESIYEELGHDYVSYAPVKDDRYKTKSEKLVEAWSDKSRDIDLMYD